MGGYQGSAVGKRAVSGCLSGRRSGKRRSWNLVARLWCLACCDTLWRRFVQGETGRGAAARRGAPSGGAGRRRVRQAHRRRIRPASPKATPWRTLTRSAGSPKAGSAGSPQAVAQGEVGTVAVVLAVERLRHVGTWSMRFAATVTEYGLRSEAATIAASEAVFAIACHRPPLRCQLPRGVRPSSAHTIPSPNPSADRQASSVAPVVAMLSMK